MSVENKKHSDLGIASFCICILGGVLLILLIFTSRALFDSACASPIASQSALGLGIGGFLQKDRENLFAILGIIFSALVILIFCVFWINLMIGMVRVEYG